VGELRAPRCGQPRARANLVHPARRGIPDRRAARRSAVESDHAAAAAQAGQQLFDAELHRLEGELVLASGATTEDEALFRRAIEIGRAQEAKAFGLRAATGLARLWRDQGRAAGARDLVDATALLDELRL